MGCTDSVDPGDSSAFLVFLGSLGSLGSLDSMDLVDPADFLDDFGADPSGFADPEDSFDPLVCASPSSFSDLADFLDCVDFACDALRFAADSFAADSLDSVDALLLDFAAVYRLAGGAFDVVYGSFGCTAGGGSSSV